MKYLVFILFQFFSILFAQAQLVGFNIHEDMPTGTELLTTMHKLYKNGPCKRYTFSQKNEHYRNDSLIGNSEWYEAIEFPDKFRINFGNPSIGNFVIFKNDSAFSYRNFVLKKQDYNANTLLLLLGGMYYRELDDLITRLKNEKYNLEKVSFQKWRKEKCYVIGALKGDSISNQIWVSKTNYRIIRIIESMDSENSMDISFDNYQKHCNGFTETKVTFKKNYKIEQIETYYDIKNIDSFAEEVFNPKEVEK